MRYIIGFLGVIAVLILVIVLIVRGGGDSAKSADIDLADYLTSSSQVRYTVDGQVSASETHYISRVIIDESEARIEVIRGYQDDIIRSRTYPMNPSSYAAFMLSLKRANYTVGNTDSDFRDERGYCPIGSRYIYELYDDGKQTQRFWNTSCDEKLGTFKGNAPLVRQLFELQIPAYGELTSDLNFGSSSFL
jgi:hypothetical protein